MKNNATIADLIAKMRKTKYGNSECEVKWCLSEWADSFDEAWRRELGDCEKLRDALKRLDELLYIGADGEVHSFMGKAKEVERTIKDALAATSTAEKPSEVGDSAKLRKGLVSLERQVKPLSLDEAISHADKVAGDCGTACKREHRQLADWLRELKSRRSAEYGNAAKLREAVKAAIYKLMLWNYTDRDTAKMALGIMGKLDLALDEPPRNCDVGTADDQVKRLRATMCNTTKSCPDPNWSCGKCALVWAQMLYEEGVENEDK